MQHALFPLLFLASLARSAPVAQVQKTCQEYIFPLNVTSMNLKWALDSLETNEDQAAYNAQTGRRDSASVFHPVTLPTAPESATYSISGTFCRPTSGGNGTVLLATHGGGYDRYYWDPSYQPENYSFADYSISQGYSIFYYDRLGIGKSEVISGYVLQASIQGAIIAELAKVIRAGQLGTPVSKIALVGHSLGSVFSNIALHSNSNLVDAAVLTGIAYNNTTKGVSDQAKQNRLAKLQEPLKWGHLDGGWNTWIDVFSNIEGFFKVPYFDPALAQWAEDHKQPSAILENISIQTANFSSPAFTGPVMIMSGEYDFIACGGYCPGILDQKTAAVFPASKDLDVYVQPNTGHAINFGLNATGAFDVITSFLKRNGI